VQGKLLRRFAGKVVRSFDRNAGRAGLRRARRKCASEGFQVNVAMLPAAMTPILQILLHGAARTHEQLGGIRGK